MEREPTTICAIATAPGPAGLAVVRLSGPEAYACAAKVFCPKNPARKVEEARGYTALFGHFLHRGEEMDETVALFFRAPHSYTGEDVVELSVHGGSEMARLLVESLILAGASPAGPGEFTRRAFENGRMDLTQAESVMDLIAAGGKQGAALGLAALGGALAREIGGIKEGLLALGAHLAAWVDFPEENVPELEEKELLRALAEGEERLHRLISSYGAGAVLRNGVDTVLLGRPNVGKSTLLNLLAGFERAIVTPVAGTTRDVVEQAVRLGESGLRLNLFDTAGLRETEDEAEAEGVRRSLAKLEEASLVLAVFDGARPLEAEDWALAEKCRGRQALALVNKSDLAQCVDPKALEPYFAGVVLLSAREPESRAELERAVEALLGTAQVDTHAASLSGERQLAAAVRAEGALRDAAAAYSQGFGFDAVGVCLDEALAALAELTGEDAGEAVIDEVFSRFCVGK